MKYPRTPRDDKKSVKIKSKDIEIIKDLFYVKKWSKAKIARFFKVQSKTIRRNLDPIADKKHRQWHNNYKKRCYEIDENFRNRAKKLASNYVKNRYNTDLDYRKYRNDDNKLYRNKNLDKIHLVSKKYRQIHKEEIRLKAQIKHYKKRLQKLV